MALREATEQEIAQLTGQETAPEQEARAGSEPMDGAKDRTFGGGVARQLGLMARAAATPETVGMAAGALAGLPMRAPGAGAQAGGVAGLITNIGSEIYKALSGDPNARSVNDILEEAKTAIGLPKPETGAERLQERVIQGATAAIPGVQAGRMLTAAAKSPALRAVGQELARSPVVQGASAVSGAAAGALTEEQDYGPAMQTAATIAGGLLPGSAARVATVGRQAREFGVAKFPAAITSVVGVTEPTRAATIRLLRAGRPQEKLAQTLGEYRAAGTTPSLGQLTESPTVQQLETTAGRFPSGLSTMREKVISQQQEIGQRVQELRAQASPIKEPYIVGRGAKKGFEEVFVPRARATQRALYDKADSLIPPTLVRIQPTRTQQALDNVLQRFEDTPELQGQLGNKQLMAIREAIASGKNEAGDIPLSTMRDLRAWAGEKLANVDLTPDISRAQVKAIYKALSEDFDAAVSNFDKTKQAFSRANNFTRAFHDRMDMVQDTLSRSNPDEIYRSILSNSAEGPTKLTAMLRSIPKDDQKAVVSAFVNRMGRVAPGMQDETGELFSSRTFLTNYNKLDKASRQVLFGRFGSKYQQDLQKIATVADKIDKASQVLANPPGTAAAGGAIGSAMAIGGGVASGKFGFASGVIGTLIGANQAAKLYTNPRFVEWLASNIDKPISRASGLIGSLSTIASDTDDPDMAAFAEELKQEMVRRDVEGR
jgi:hypothetical protein